MNWGIFVLLITAIGGVALWLGHQQSMKMRVEWKPIAMQMGLTFEPTKWYSWGRPPKVRGEYRSRPIVLTNIFVGPSDSARAISTITLTVRNQQGISFTIFPVGWFHKIGKTMRMRDASIGDKKFDSRLSFKCNPPELAATVLSADRLRHELIMLYDWTGIVLYKTKLIFASLIVEKDVQRLERIFNLVSDLADAIEGKQKR